MKLGAFQLIVCTVIWSVLIGMGLFMLQPAVGQSRVPHAARASRSHKMGRAVLKPGLPNAFLADYWATVMTHDLKNPQRKKEITKLKKELHESKKIVKRDQLANMLWDAVDDRIAYESSKKEIRYRAGRLKHREVVSGKNGIVDELATVLARYHKKALYDVGGHE